MNIKLFLVEFLFSSTLRSSEVSEKDDKNLWIQHIFIIHKAKPIYWTDYRALLNWIFTFHRNFSCGTIFKIGSMNLFSMDVYLWQLCMYFKIIINSYRQILPINFSYENRIINDLKMVTVYAQNPEYFASLQVCWRIKSFLLGHSAPLIASTCTILDF